MAPDYELDQRIDADTAAKLKAVVHPLRSQILDLVLERAATVTELAIALDRPKSTLAYHVDTLMTHGFLQVVRTRKVRAIEERFYGRTARTIVFGPSSQANLDLDEMPQNFLAEAEAEASKTAEGLQATLRHARIDEERADEFFSRVVALAEEFTALPRAGGTVFGFVAAVYPTDHPTLPEANA